MNWRDDIIDLARALRPEGLLAVMPENEPLRERLADYGCQAECRVVTPSSLLDPDAELPRSELAIVAGTLEHMSKREAGNVVARLRDLYAKVLYAAVPIGNDWPGMTSRWRNEDLVALGLRQWRQYAVEGKSLVLYHYDIYDYKHTPDWLNSKYWANPERWDQERW